MKRKIVFFPPEVNGVMLHVEAAVDKGSHLWLRKFSRHLDYRHLICTGVCRRLSSSVLCQIYSQLFIFHKNTIQPKIVQSLPTFANELGKKGGCRFTWDSFQDTCNSSYLQQPSIYHILGLSLPKMSHIQARSFRIRQSSKKHIWLKQQCEHN